MDSRRRGEPRGEGEGERRRGMEEEKGERGEKKEKKSEVWVPPTMVGIERRYKEWMSAEKLNVD